MGSFKCDVDITYKRMGTKQSVRWHCLEWALNFDGSNFVAKGRTYRCLYSAGLDTMDDEIAQAIIDLTAENDQLRRTIQEMESSISGELQTRIDQVRYAFEWSIPSMRGTFEVEPSLWSVKQRSPPSFLCLVLKFALRSPSYLILCSFIATLIHCNCLYSFAQALRRHVVSAGVSS